MATKPTQMENLVVERFQHYQIRDEHYMRSSEGLSANQVANRLAADKARLAEDQGLLLEWQEYADAAIQKGGPYNFQVWRGVKAGWGKILAEAGITDYIAIAKNGNGNGTGRPERDSLATTQRAEAILMRGLPVVVAVEMRRHGRKTEMHFMSREDMADYIAAERAAQDDPSVMQNLILGVYEGSEEVMRVMAFVSELRRGHSSAQALHHARFMHRMDRMPQCRAFFEQYRKGDKNDIYRKACAIADKGLAEVAGLQHVGFYALYEACKPGSEGEKRWNLFLANPDEYPASKLAEDLISLQKGREIAEIGQRFNKVLGDSENRAEYYPYDKVKQVVELANRELKLRQSAQAELVTVKQDLNTAVGVLRRGTGNELPTDDSIGDFYRDAEAQLLLGRLLQQAMEQAPEGIAQIIRGLNLGGQDEMVAQHVLGQLTL